MNDLFKIPKDIIEDLSETHMSLILGGSGFDFFQTVNNGKMCNSINGGANCDLINQGNKCALINQSDKCSGINNQNKCK